MQGKIRRELRNSDAVIPAFARVCSVGYAPKYTGGIFSVNTLPDFTGVFGTAAIPYRTLG